MFVDAKWETNNSRADSVAGKAWIPEVLHKEVKLCVPAQYVHLVAGASPGTKNWGSGFLVKVLQRGFDE